MTKAIPSAFEPRLLEDEIAILKLRKLNVTKELSAWRKKISIAPESPEARRQVSIYEKMDQDLKAMIRNAQRIRTKINAPPKSTQKKWSPVLPGTFGSGKRK